MIERIQTVFLFLVTVVMAVMLFLPSWEVSSGDSRVVVTAFEMVHTKGGKVVASASSVYIAIVALLAAGIALYTIFQFKNRGLQIRLCLLNTLVISGALGAVVLAAMQAEKMLSVSSGNYQVAFFCPAVALIFNMLARRFIVRDESLVRSMDRLR